MRISKIIVENYRSIESVEIEPSEFSIFVGQNNHGKTNFFEAIEWFYNSKDSSEDEYHKKEKGRVISVEIFFSNVIDSDIEKLKTDSNKTKIRDLLDEKTAFSVKKTSIDHKRKYYVDGVARKNPSGIDPAINEFLPKLEYVNTKICLEDVSKYKDRNPIGIMLSGVLTAIIENSQEYIDFKDQFSKLFDSEDSEVRKELNKLGKKVEIYLQKQFPDGTKVKFGVNPPNFSDLLKSFDTTVDDGVETKAEAKGDGMQRAIMLSIIQAFADYRKEQSGGGAFLFMIDEAELHLHPSAQRALKNALLDISETDQVLVNTHSSVLVVDNNEKQKIYKVEKANKVTNITEINDNQKIDVVFDLLGGSPSDLLLPRNFLIVEGRSEYTFLTKIIERFYAREYKDLKILFAGGDLDEQEPSLLAVHKLFVPLAGNDNPIYKDKAIVLLDKPNSEQMTKYELFKKGYPYLFKNNQIFELSTETFEEYYPDKWKKTKCEVANQDKVKYAQLVGEEISKEQFESEMPVLLNALQELNNKAFNING